MFHWAFTLDMFPRVSLWKSRNELFIAVRLCWWFRLLLPQHTRMHVEKYLFAWLSHQHFPHSIQCLSVLPLQHQPEASLKLKMGISITFSVLIAVLVITILLMCARRRCSALRNPVLAPPQYPNRNAFVNPSFAGAVSEPTSTSRFSVSLASAFRTKNLFFQAFELGFGDFSHKSRWRLSALRLELQNG